MFNKLLDNFLMSSYVPLIINVIKIRIFSLEKYKSAWILVDTEEREEFDAIISIQE